MRHSKILPNFPENKAALIVQKTKNDNEAFIKDSNATCSFLEYNALYIPYNTFPGAE
ncbi:9424_t:CDS:1, partial [Funneliformis geosporum]